MPIPNRRSSSVPFVSAPNSGTRDGGQVPNPQQNGNALPPNQMHNLVGVAAPPPVLQHNRINMDADMIRVRTLMRDTIYQRLLHRLTQPADETRRMKFEDFAKRIEEGLFRAAHTKEDYMNVDTLGARLTSLIRAILGNSHNQRLE